MLTVNSWLVLLAAAVAAFWGMSLAWLVWVWLWDRRQGDRTTRGPKRWQPEDVLPKDRKRWTR